MEHELCWAQSHVLLTKGANPIRCTRINEATHFGDDDEICRYTGLIYFVKTSTSTSVVSRRDGRMIMVVTAMTPDSFLLVPMTLDVVIIDPDGVGQTPTSQAFPSLPILQDVHHQPVTVSESLNYRSTSIHPVYHEQPIWQAGTL